MPHNQRMHRRCGWCADCSEDHFDRNSMILAVIPLGFRMSERHATLRLSKAERLCLVGCALFILSLLLPAAKLGSGPTCGISWFALGTLTAFYPENWEPANLSRVALLLNLSCLFTIVTIFNRFMRRLPRICAAGIGLFCAAVLSVYPCPDFEQIYFGYYVWIISASWILATPVLSEILGWETTLRG